MWLSAGSDSKSAQSTSHIYSRSAMYRRLRIHAVGGVSQLVCFFDSGATICGAARVNAADLHVYSTKNSAPNSACRESHYGL